MSDGMISVQVHMQCNAWRTMACTRARTQHSKRGGGDGSFFTQSEQPQLSTRAVSARCTRLHTRIHSVQ
eukprot:9412034-Alexandrium_andersonii.AAC.1